MRVRRYLAETMGADTAAIEAWQDHWMRLGLTALEAALAEGSPSKKSQSHPPGNGFSCEGVFADAFGLDYWAR